jgi:5-methyltetrahydrofolate--homocysteine methyltransferase
MSIETDVRRRLGEALHAGDVQGAESAVAFALENAMTAHALLDALRSIMDEVGQKYQSGEYFIPELVMSGQAAQAGVQLLLPHIAAGSGGFLATVVLGTVAGDIHDLGKMILFTTLSAAGFQVFDLGVDVPAAKFVEKAVEVDARIIAASALMSTTKLQMKGITEAIVEAGLRSKVKIMFGGAAVTPEYAHSIGADGYARDAYEAVEIARSLVS